MSNLTCSNVRQPFQCRINIVNQDMKVPYFSRIIAGGDYFFFRTKRGRSFEGRRLFQIVVTGSRALNIYFFNYAIKSKINHIKLTERGMEHNLKSNNHLPQSLVACDKSISFMAPEPTALST